MRAVLALCAIGFVGESLMLAKHWPAVGLLVILCVASSAGDRRVTAASLPNDAGKPSTKFKHGKWPFYPPVRPAVPEVQDKAWVRNPIDAFILHALETKGLTPSREADKLTLLRRVTFDLTGLPPTPEEQDAFLADESPRTLMRRSSIGCSPRRATASVGRSTGSTWSAMPRPTASRKTPIGRMRTSIAITSFGRFNADLPYDRFIRQQLAGDELEPDNPEALVATGYCRLYPDEYNAADVRQRRQEILDDVTDTTGLAFLGLTIGCAQCHNHKFDTILQTDYYRLQAFFTPMLPRDDLAEATCSEQRRNSPSKQAAWEEATAEIRAEMEATRRPAAPEGRRGGPRKVRRRGACRRSTRRRPSGPPLQEQIVVSRR